MAPALSNPYPDSATGRPPKRPRKDSKSGHYDSDDNSHNSHNRSSPLDHIFISESLAPKKSGGKKQPLSCCECRRLKLKCDRNFPCGSCRKRGVSDICPEGVLVSGRGTRFILANTEQLHGKIHEMSDRIRHLEEALSNYNTSHHLLDSDLLNIKSTMGLYGTSQTGSEHNEHDRWTDPRMDIEFDPHNEVHHSTLSVRRPPEKPHETTQQLETEIQRLSHCFPLSDRVSSESNTRVRAHIREKLPPREEAEHLWRQANQNALWQYNPHPNETFFPNLLHHCYETPVEELSSRRLALIFMILAVGCVVDLERRGPDSPDAENYHTLARAALAETSVMDDTTVETITALFYEMWYLLVFADKRKAVSYAWGIMGLTAKLAQSIALHRKRSRGKKMILPEELEDRRSLFWELLYLDARLSLSLGRPPSLSLAHVDCQRPSYALVPGSDASDATQYYQDWKHSCYVHCLAPVLEAVSQPNLEYANVLALDNRIRGFSVPQPFKHANLQGRALVMQKGSLATAQEALLLQLHRSFFTRAVSGTEMAFNRNHVYAPSVVAVFLSSSRMIATVQDLYHREPALTARILGFWTNAFSATVALCLLVSRAPFTCLTPATLQELERARALFTSAKQICPRAAQVLPVLETMINKAIDIFARWASGQQMPTIVLRHHDDDIDRHDTTSPPPTSDAFKNCHRSLVQCIAEVHDRAKFLFPMRKPCNCSTRNSPPPDCPPSHSWAPPPKLAPSPPVLPEIYLSTLSRGVTASSGTGAVPPLSPTSKFAMVDTLNFELGDLSPGTDQSWMAWF